MGGAHIPWGKSHMRRVHSSEMYDFVDHTDGKFVCADCFGDKDIKNFIRTFDTEKDEWDTCSYCNNPQGLHLDWVSRRIYDTKFQELFVDAEDALPFSYEWGGYMGSTVDSADALWECNLGVENEQILLDIGAAFPDREWASRLTIANDEAEMAALWEKEQEEEDEKKRRIDEWRKFRRYVMHKRRYFLHSPIKESLSAEVIGILEDVGNTASIIPCQTIYRARAGFFDARDNERYIREPRARKSLMPNRMSPAGVRMFYGSNDPKAALYETYNKNLAKDGDIVTVSEFKVATSVCVFDLVNLDKMMSSSQHVSKDCGETGDKGKTARFLKEFAQAIAKRVYKDEKKHIEYVPTQIITEYLRISKLPNGKKPMGILYPSACMGDCLPESKQWFCVALFTSGCLKLNNINYYRVKLRKKNRYPEFELLQISPRIKDDS